MNFLHWARTLARALAPSRSAVKTLDREHELAQELLHPDWKPIEDHFGAAVPAILKQFYAEPAKLLQVDFNLVSPHIEIPQGIYIKSFDKMSAGSVEGFFEGLERFIPLAHGCGAELYVIDPTEADPEVFLHVYDLDDDPELFRFTGLRLSPFLQARRVPAKRLAEIP